MNTQLTAFVGNIFKRIEGMEPSSTEIRFFDQYLQEYRMFHSQECCEDVFLLDVCGDPADLIGAPILSASEEVSKQPQAGKLNDEHDSFTWTFYRFSTIKGTVTLRWYGSSNGYYSETVLIEKVKRETEDKHKSNPVRLKLS